MGASGQAGIRLPAEGLEPKADLQLKSDLTSRRVSEADNDLSRKFLLLDSSLLSS